MTYCSGVILPLSAISTHTLTWSVTHSLKSVKQDFEYFNSHAHVERDSNCRARTRNRIYFNSHAHVERDIPDDFLRNIEVDFNSHAHVERDVMGAISAFTADISTHTLTWSVTLRN